MTAETTNAPNVSSYPLPVERNLIIACLAILSAGAWAVLIWQGAGMDDEMSLTMGMSAALFIGLWIVMMVAIMFPTAAPMILMFARVHNGKKARGDNFVPTWIFTVAYLLVWSITGVAAYAVALGADALADESEWVMENAPRFGGGLLVLAGLYQLTPLKDICLRKCRTPISFVLSSWRDGYGGAFRMGVEHGVYCLGCCWLLFLILFPLGMMNVAVLALVTLLIFAEKSLPVGRQVARATAAGFILFGALVIAVPDALPMAMDDSHMKMSGATDLDEMSDTGGMGDSGAMNGEDQMPGTGESESMPADGMQ
jgi:predicted metal-binding membrane protein